MRALLTSAGIKNSSIHDALVDVLDKPIAESNALFIPTGVYPFPGGPGMAWLAICGNFAVIPHLEHADHPDASLANAERWAARIPAPTYAIDDETAIRVVDGAAQVVSEGHWKLIQPLTGPGSS
jgi:hypothetical protein